MINIQIKRGNQWYEIDYNETSISLSYNATVLNNPTQYTTEYSKSIELPLTKNNLNAFGLSTNLDSLQTTSLSLARSIPIRVFDGSDLIIEGSFRITSVNLDGNDGKTITGNIYSVVNEWFNKMLKLNFENGLQSYTEESLIMNKQLVKDSFENDPSTRATTLVLPGSPQYSIHDFIGFAPTINGEGENFSNSTIVRRNGNEVIQDDVWNILGVNDSQKESADSINDKPSERMMMQYRSWMQKPYFYMDSLTRLLAYTANTTEDLPAMRLDPRWFNVDNPLWRDVVYILPNIISEDNDTNTTHWTQTPIELNYNLTDVRMPFYQTFSVYENDINLVKDHYFSDNGTKIVNGEIIGDGKPIFVDFSANLNLEMSASANWGSSPAPQWEDPKMKLLGRIEVWGRLADSDGNIISDSEKRILYLNKNNSLCDVGIWDYPEVVGQTVTYHSIYTWNLFKTTDTYSYEGSIATGKRVHFQTILKVFMAPVNEQSSGPFDDPDELYGSATWQPHNRVMIPSLEWRQEFIVNTRRTTYGRNITMEAISTDVYSNTSQKTNVPLTSSFLWKTENENTPFRVFLKYCKMMNLYFHYDSFANIITVTPRENFFLDSYNRYNIEDYSKKIDYSQEMTFNPIQWEDKYILFNYNNLDQYKLNDFYEKYKYAYGSKKIETFYEYNDSTKELFEKNYVLNCSAEGSIFTFTIKDMKDLVTDIGSTPMPKLVNESYIINKKNESTANVNDCFFFRLPSRPWDTTINVRPNGTSSNVWITDDSLLELRNNKFSYQDIWWTGGFDIRVFDAVAVDAWPVLSKYYTSETGSYCLHYSSPAEDYFNPDVITRNDNDLYNSRWKKMIEEIYNEQNKKVTLYAWLDSNDYRNITNGRFIRIENVIYFVNKIVDYNLTIHKPTKLELIQIFNLNSYLYA